MKAIRIHDYGNADVLRYEDAPMPEPGPDEVLIKIHGAGVNPVEWKIRNGMMRQARPVKFPAILGSDAAGIVERVGPVVTRVRPGDAVVARVDGSYAEYAVVKTDAVGRAAKSIPLAHVAALPIAAGTAWTTLFESARLVKGARILVHGGAGGVGTFAIQLAKLAGYHVIATTSAGNRALVQSLGADEVIDYRAEDVSRAVKDVELAFDTVGGATMKGLFAVVKKGGQLLSIVSPPDEALAKEHGIDARFVRSNVTGTRLEEICGLIDAGKVKVVIEREFPLAEAKAALALSEAGHVHGKIVLRVA
ncbi:MAG TPA: NADP-dependent oxidoreductase [Stellaceae bacterium]|nr:NADP-dependent oxidoreductase [Stellaceae bacterium]